MDFHQILRAKLSSEKPKAPPLPSQNLEANGLSNGMIWLVTQQPPRWFAAGIYKKVNQKNPPSSQASPEPIGDTFAEPHMELNQLSRPGQKLVAELSLMGFHFAGAITLHGLRREYCRLLRSWHPDLRGGGSEKSAELERLVANYNELVTLLKNQLSSPGLASE